MAQEVGGVLVNAISAGAFQFILAVTAREQAYSQRASTASASKSQTLSPTTIEVPISTPRRSQRQETSGLAY
jgi:hypothetical protein